KIDMNRAVISTMAGATSRAEAADAFERGLERIRGMEMPYLAACLERNLATALGASARPPQRLPRSGAGHRVSLQVPLDAGDVSWSLLLSVHWRY
ncbi:hypothetical protein B7486_66095, partial [cyanobacterium TDX16]